MTVLFRSLVCGSVLTVTAVAHRPRRAFFGSASRTMAKDLPAGESAERYLRDLSVAAHLSFGSTVLSASQDIESTFATSGRPRSLLHRALHRKGQSTVED